MDAAAGGEGSPLFPPVQPRRSGYLAVGDGHHLYFEECGPADGVPVVFLHGGPGSGCTPAQRRLFDPRRHRVILFDQRGCGRSEPLGRLAANTTSHLVADLERLRQALHIPAWFVFGGSWGSTLALAYAQAHAGRVRGLVLRGIFLGTAEEIAAYAAGLPDLTGTGGDGAERLATYARHILGPNPRAAGRAARAWLDHESAAMGAAPTMAAIDAGSLAKVRLQMHYLTGGCFLETPLLAGIDPLRSVPAVIVQGLADPVCPPQHAERLRRAWPEAAWVPVSGGGHGGLSPAIAAATMAALDRLVVGSFPAAVAA